MRERLIEIRRRAQEPVRQYNDIAGRLVGDHVSLYVTRIFIALNISPTVATISMLLFGLVGASLIPLGGGFAVAGFVCIFCYYICDCVDGEVARFKGCEKLLWGFHDFLFHLYVKSAFFIALGVLAARVSGEPWLFLFGLSALLATLLTKFLDDVGVLVACRQILMRPRDGHRMQLNGLMAEATEGAPSEAKRKPYSRLGQLRAILTNFDLASLLFIALAIADLWTSTISLFGLSWSLTTLAVAVYGIVLPLDYLDRMQHAIRTDEFGVKAREMLRRADEFRIDEGE